MPTTQQKIPIKEIKKGLLVLNNGNLRAVLMASSTNFALRNKEEQEAIIYKFQEFLNSLDFPVQIMVNSRALNLTPYLNMLDKKIQDQKNELLLIQAQEYKKYIQELVKISDIMTKTFFVVVPFDVAVTEKGGILSKLTDVFRTNKKSEQDESDFQTLANQLWQRVEFVSGALGGVGIQTIPLKTEELIELFYDLFNPGATKSHGLKKETIEELIGKEKRNNNGKNAE